MEGKDIIIGNIYIVNIYGYFAEFNEQRIKAMNRLQCMVIRKQTYSSQKFKTWCGCKFFVDIGGHDLGGSCKHGFGWNIPAEFLIPQGIGVNE